MAITFNWSNVVALAPELETVSDAAQAEVLAMVGDEVDPGIWGSQARADRAGVWLARHLGTFALAKSGMGSAPVSSVSVGGVSKSFSIGSDLMSTLTLTKYGIEYLRLVRLFLPRFGVL